MTIMISVNRPQLFKAGFLGPAPRPVPDRYTGKVYGSYQTPETKIEETMPDLGWGMFQAAHFNS